MAKPAMASVMALVCGAAAAGVTRTAEEHRVVEHTVAPVRSARYREYVEAAADRLSAGYSRPGAVAKAVLAGHAHDVLGLAAVHASRWVWGACANESHAESASGLLRTYVDVWINDTNTGKNK